MYGLKREFFIVAIARESVESALQQFIDSSNLFLSSKDINILISNGYGNSLVNFRNGYLLSFLKINKQIELIINAGKKAIDINYLLLTEKLPFASKKILSVCIRKIQPTEKIRELLLVKKDIIPNKNTEDFKQYVYEMKTLEIYISCLLLLLNKYRISQQNNQNQEQQKIQNLLKNTLRDYFGIYRTSIIIQRCIDTNNHDLLSLIHHQNGNYNLALQFIFLGFENELLKNEINAIAYDKLLSQIFNLINSVLDPEKSKINEKTRSKIITNLISKTLLFWKKMGFPFEEIEKFILEKNSKMMDYLDIESKQVMSSFSSNFLIFVLKQKMLRILDNYKQENTKNNSEIKDILNKIEVNISSNVEKKESRSFISFLMEQNELFLKLICLAHFDPENLMEIKKQEKENIRNDNQLIMFNCEHSYPKSSFYSTLLKEFYERITDFPFSLNYTTKLILDCFSNQKFQFACPVCVFNFIQEQILSKNPKIKIQKWNV
ncbi:hypothetical protein M0811_03950 [Anaeramoeba ignava]|uniref:Uncharacterized protein n=1 Tax=Anaeramoeba ignava TaxID=1746090 RepID=A0A9Q0LTG4_ANAIG|nr:hypothetical protein M0811_03950 [Anaeramoeba ignava]